MKAKDIFKITAIPVTFASLCCLSPLVLFLLGLTTASFAASLSDTLYGEYKWVFRGIGLLTLLIGIFIYYRSKGVCTLDQAKKKRNEIINTTLIVLIVGIVGYIVFLYGIVNFVGWIAGVW